MEEKLYPPAFAGTEGRSVALEVRILNTLVRRQVDGQLCCRADMPQERLHRSQGMVLDYLYERQEQAVFQRDVEARFQISRSTATGVIQNMEKNGLLTREPVDYDARLKRLKLTDKALTMHSRFLEAMADCEQALRQQISPADLAAFFRVTDMMKKNLAEREDRK